MKSHFYNIYRKLDGKTVVLAFRDGEAGLNEIQFEIPKLYSLLDDQPTALRLRHMIEEACRESSETAYSKPQRKVIYKPSWTVDSIYWWFMKMWQKLFE